MKNLLSLTLLLVGHAAVAQIFSATVNDSIPDDGSTKIFELTVSGLPTSIDTFFGLESVCLNLLHTYDQDMDVRLQAPNGKTIVLISGAGGAGHDFLNTCMSETGTPFSAGNPPFSGNFQSYGILGYLNNGQDPNGTWRLICYDTYAFADRGFLQDWSITFGNNPAKPFIFRSSDLPIVKFTTLGQEIVDEPKVPVLMQILDHGHGLRNFADQMDYAYEGQIAVELQGYTGPYYPKKNYDFKLLDTAGNSLDTTILGMPREHDWIFKAEYLDHTLLKNALTYEMCRRMGRYAPRTRFCELVLDGEYIGLFTLTEKVKRDANRVKIAKLTAADTTGTALTGGYIIEMNINNAPGDWDSPTPPINNATCQLPVEFKYVYPSRDKIQPAQGAYIQAFVDSFENALLAPNFADPQLGYRQYASVRSFIDFLIVNEFSVNYDSYGRSTYLVKEKSTDGGQLKIGPPWDYDRAFEYVSPEKAEGWVWEKTHEYWPFPFWWSRMWEDGAYRKQLACRWANLRENTLADTAFLGLIDTLTAEIQEAQTRNFRIWNDLGTLPFAGQIDSLKSFTLRRLRWIDATLADFRTPPDAGFSSQRVDSTSTFVFTPNTSGATNYSWDFGDGASSSEAAPMHHFPASGSYLVVLTVGDSLGCPAQSSQQLVQFLSTSHEVTSLDWQVFPNPFSAKIQVQPTPVGAVFQLSDCLGRVVFSGKNLASHDFSELPAGVYFLKILGRKTGEIRLVKN